MSYRFLRIGIAIVAAALAGCQKKEGGATEAKNAAPPAPKPVVVEAVKEPERSKHFSAVNKHLDLGGTMYGYVDIDGDVLKIAELAQGWLREAAKTQPQMRPVANADLADIVRTLGFSDVKAFGFSSVQENDGMFRNRTFIYTGGERHGLMAALGGKAAPFKHINLAPADTDMFVEHEIDAGQAYLALKQVTEKIAGEPVAAQLEGMLKKAGDAATFSVLELIHGLKGRSGLVLRVDPEKTMTLPGREPAVIPEFKLLMCVEGVGSILESSFAKERNLTRREVGAARIYTPRQPVPIPGFEPAIIVEGTTLYFTTSLAFYEACRAQKSSLGQNPEFQRTLARLGNEGNGLTYVSPRLFERVRDLEKLNPNMPPQAKSVLALVLAQIPQAKQPLISVRTNTDDGILIRSYWSSSLKADVVGVAAYNPMTVGVLAAMAIPAFQKVRTSSQEKAVMNNLRQLAAAADQHYLETGTTTATYDQLVGPNRYIKVVHPVAGENYRSIRFVHGQPLRVRLASGKMVEYSP